MTPADARAAGFRDRGLGAEPAGDRVRGTVTGLPLKPLPVSRVVDGEVAPATARTPTANFAMSGGGVKETAALRRKPVLNGLAARRTSVPQGSDR